MAIFRIRQIDDVLMQQLRERAAHNERSVEQEAQAILENALGWRRGYGGATG